jgi:hypothetical protein
MEMISFMQMHSCSEQKRHVDCQWFSYLDTLPVENELAASALRADRALVNGTPRKSGFPPSGFDPLRDAAGQRAFGFAVTRLPA